MIKVLSYNIADIIKYINWLYFFHAWGFAAKYSAITEVHRCKACVQSWINNFTDENEKNCAREAAKLYDDALKILDDCNGVYECHAKFGIFDAYAQNDDIIILDSNGNKVLFPCLRQQTCNEGDTCLCLADFIRPAAYGQNDHIGVFAATTDRNFELRHQDDDYRHMLCQTLADRLAEAATELMHLQIRRKYWGYAKNERLTTKQLFTEKFQGIRPAVGYPSLPDQSVIFIIEKLIKTSEIGIQITESGAMQPHASVCGLIFAHPKARYFNVGKINSDQIEDYAHRRNLSKDIMMKFLRSNL